MRKKRENETKKRQNKLREKENPARVSEVLRNSGLRSKTLSAQNNVVVENLLKLLQNFKFLISSRSPNEN